MIYSPTHDELVGIAARWLRYSQDCTVIITELISIVGVERPDVIGWRSGLSALVECKVSRLDFFNNAKKNHGWGMGYQRFFLTPQQLVMPQEVPTGWGLLEWDGSKVRATKRMLPRKTYARNAEIDLLLTALRRISPSAKGVSVKLYTLAARKGARVDIEPESAEPLYVS